MDNEQNKINRRIYIIPAVVLICVIISAVILINQEQKSDRASEKIIREIASTQLNKDPNELTDEDFEKVTELEFVGAELSDIKLLEKFTNLQKLVISNEVKLAVNKIPTWKLILYKLGIIDFRNRIDLSPLKKLSNLHTLETLNSHVTNLETLKELKLKTLWLYNAKVSDLKPIKGFNSLQILRLEGTQVSDLEPLNGLTNLQELYLTRTQVSDLKPIKGLINLQILNLESTQVSDLEPLKELTNLQELYLTRTQVFDLMSLKGLVNLRNLHIQDCPNITEEQVEELQKALPNLQIKR